MRFPFLSLGCLVAAAACSRRPERPQGIPATAVAVGNPKRYEFIDCASVSGPDFDCNVFSETRGQLIATGRFRLLPPSSPFNPVDATEYAYRDGPKIVLTHGRRLEAIEPPRPPGVPTTATWAGGPECGSFVDCSPEDVGALYQCSVFHERTGTLVARGEYRLYGTPTGPFKAPCNLSGVHRLVSANGGPYYLEEVRAAP
jgi:hypothetical protein